MISESNIRHSTTSPCERIASQQYIVGVIMFGSYLTMLHDRRINPSALLTLLFKHSELQEIFVSMTGCESFKESVFGLLQLYPVLIKSKNTKQLIKQLHGSRSRRPNRIRETDLQ
jgi:hypothetical protein